MVLASIVECLWVEVRCGIRSDEFYREVNVASITCDEVVAYPLSHEVKIGGGRL